MHLSYSTRYTSNLTTLRHKMYFNLTLLLGNQSLNCQTKGIRAEINWALQIQSHAAVISHGFQLICKAIYFIVLKAECLYNNKPKIMQEKSSKLF